MKIAIVKLSALGDIVHAMVALQFIKHSEPDLEIDWVVEKRFAGVLENNPHINQILTVDIKSLKNNKTRFFKELINIRQFSKHGYDLVIDAQGLIKSAVTAKLISSNVAGFDSNSIREQQASWFYQRTVNCAYDANTIDRNVAVIGLPLGINITSQQIINKSPFLFYQAAENEFDDYFSKQKNNIVFVIGSTWPSRNYPKEQYLNVINELDANSLIIWGNESEKSTAEWIASKTNKATVLPQLDFNQLKQVLAQSDLVIGNDTGPTHMAWGLNKPSITLFGPTPVSRVYQTKINKVLKSPSVVNPFKLDKNDFSIKDIHPQDVMRLASSLLI